MNTKIELNRFISNNSRYSRRKSTQLIKSGSVYVNNKIVYKPYLKVNLYSDKIAINNKTINPIQTNKRHFLVNKPSGYVSSTKPDSSGSPPITSIIPSTLKLYPVGRLDIDSEGLIILTNDGDLTHKLTHPSSNIEKEYLIQVTGKVTSRKIKVLQEGVPLKEGVTKPCKIKIIDNSKNSTTLSIILTQGKYRQIRRMFPHVDLHITKIKRVRIGQLRIGKLESGNYRKLTKEEIYSLEK